MAVAERDHPVQTFLLDRSYEPLSVRIGVGCLERRLYHADPGLSQPGADWGAPLRVAVTDQQAMLDEQSVFCEVTVRTICCMNASLGDGVEPRICTRRKARSMTNTV